MEQKTFNDLPYEKQVKLENLALRNVMLELYVKEWEDDKRAYLMVRPLYKNPYGNELRYYTDSYSVVRACGKHLFAALRFSGHISSNGSYSFDAFYEDFYYTVDLERAKQMYNTLKWVERKIREESADMFKYGSPDSFVGYVTAVALAIGATGGVVRDSDTQVQIELSLEDFITEVASIENSLLEKFSEEAESEAVNA